MTIAIKLLITSLIISDDLQNNLRVTTLPFIFLIKVLVRKCIYIWVKIPGGSTKRLQSDNAGMWMNHLHMGLSLQSLKQSPFTDTFSTIFVRLEVSFPKIFVFKLLHVIYKWLSYQIAPIIFFNFMLKKNLINTHVSYNL